MENSEIKGENFIWKILFCKPMMGIELIKNLMENIELFPLKWQTHKVRDIFQMKLHNLQKLIESIYHENLS